MIIYLIKFGGKYKFGTTQDLKSRLKNYNCHARSIKKPRVIFKGEAINGRKIERIFKRRFSKYSIGGEWFDFDDYQVRKISSALMPFYTNSWTSHPFVRPDGYDAKKEKALDINAVYDLNDNFSSLDF